MQHFGLILCQVAQIKTLLKLQLYKPKQYNRPEYVLKYCSALWRTLYFILIHFVLYISNMSVAFKDVWVHVPVEQTGSPDFLSLT